MSNQVLITGGAGFIGTHLAKHLVSNGYSVHLVDNFARGRRDSELDELLSNPRINFTHGDLLDKELIGTLGTNFDGIYHLAAIVGVVHVANRPYDTLVSNISMLENVITLAKKQKHLSRLMFASTSEIYAGSLRYFDLEIPTPENAILTMPPLEEPRTSYMLSKLVGEAMCFNSSLPFTIVRPHNVYGPRMGLVHVVPEQLKKIWESSTTGKIEVPSSNHTRAFCYIDDAVEMLKRMLEQELCTGKVLNLGCQSPEVSIRELVNVCIEISGKNITIDEVSPTVGSPVRRAPDMTLTTKLLKYVPNVNLREGIERTWKWYLNEIFRKRGVTAR